MQAVMKTGGQQFTVKEGDELLVNLLDDVEVGGEVRFSEVLLLTDGDKNTKIGTPVVSGASVVGKVLAEVKGEKTRAVFYRRRKDSRTTRGHRPRFLKIKIMGIEG